MTGIEARLLFSFVFASSLGQRLLHRKGQGIIWEDLAHFLGYEIRIGLEPTGKA